MSFADEHIMEPVPATHVLFKCRRCSGLHSFPASEPEAELRKLIADNRTVMAIRCQIDAALSVGELIGCGPGAWPPKLPERPEPEVVVAEKKR